MLYASVHTEAAVSPPRPTYALNILAVVALVVVAACDTAPQRDVIEIDGLAMGTSWTVKIAAPASGLDPDALAAGIAGRIEAIEQSMSTYRPESALTRFNDQRGTDWVPVPGELCDVVASAIAISRASGGAFDATVGPLVDLWGFGPAVTPDEPPPPELIDAARAGSGYEKLDADCAQPALRKSVPELRVDLSAIAKGYAVDAVADVLDEYAVIDYLVEIGGEVRARGRNAAGRPWAIGIEVPDRSARHVTRVIELDDTSLATSGDYRNFFEHDGRFYSHTIDPRTGAPALHDLAAVSVVHAAAMEADAWATALLVLGPEEGPTLARELGLAALFQRRTDDGVAEEMTGEFEALLRERQAR